MKTDKKPFIILTLLIFMLSVSCENFPTEKLVSAMDSFSGNVYTSAGLIKPDTAVAERIIESMSTPVTEVTVLSTPAGAVISMAGNEDFARVNEALGNLVIARPEIAEVIAQGVMSPQTAEQQAAFSENLSTASGSKERMDVLKTELEKEIPENEQSAVKGSMALTSGILDNAAVKLEASGNGSMQEIAQTLRDISESFAETATGDGALKETDRVQMQIITNVTVAAAELAGKLDSETTKEELLETDEAKQVINGILQYNTVSDLVPGAVSIDLEGIISMAMGQEGNR